MNSVNNFDIIRTLLNFRSEDDFYFCQTLQRKKDNPDFTRSTKVINMYLVDSLEKFDRYRPRIIAECNHYGARAYFNLNRRSYKKVALGVLQETARFVSQETYKPVKNIYTKVCGQFSNEKEEKKWILDVDNLEDIDLLYKFDNPEGRRNTMMIRTINNSKPEINGSKILASIPTRNGYHLVTCPFDTREFKCEFPDVEIHKNNPTVLYIPKFN